MKPFALIILTVFSTLIVGCAVYFGYKYFVPDEVAATTETVVLTPEEATAAFSVEKNDYTVTRTYYELPAETYFLIIKKIGTAATKQQVVAEYLSNRELYISTQVAEKIGSVPIEGPDSANVKEIAIGVQLKEPNQHQTPVVAGDGTQKDVPKDK